jgi:hypothetical protein
MVGALVVGSGTYSKTAGHLSVRSIFPNRGLDERSEVLTIRIVSISSYARVRRRWRCSAMWCCFSRMSTSLWPLPPPPPPLNLLQMPPGRDALVDLSGCQMSVGYTLTDGLALGNAAS